MKKMNRRKVMKVILGSAPALLLGVTMEAKGKKGKKGKKGEKGEKGAGSNEAKKLSGKIILITEKITKSYKLAGGKVYTIARAVEGKISAFEGQTVTLYGRVVGDRIISIEVVTSN